MPERIAERGSIDADEVAALRQRARDAGFAMLNMPPEHGGIGLSMLGQVAIEEESGKATNGLGFAIVARNVRTRHGEIDLIAFDGEALTFVEVKTRRSHRRWRLSPEEQPLAWLRSRQRARVRRLAAAWLHEESRNRPAAHTIRFDAIGVVVDEADRLLCLDHLESAW